MDFPHGVLQGLTSRWESHSEPLRTICAVKTFGKRAVNKASTGASDRMRTDEQSLARAPLCRVRLPVTPWAGARQAPLSVGFSRQEDGSGLPCSLPGHLSNPGTKPGSSALQADSSPLRHWESPEQNHYRAQVGSAASAFSAL